MNIALSLHEIKASQPKKKKIRETLFWILLPPCVCLPGKLMAFNVDVLKFISVGFRLVKFILFTSYCAVTMLVSPVTFQVGVTTTGTPKLEETAGMIPTDFWLEPAVQNIVINYRRWKLIFCQLLGGKKKRWTTVHYWNPVKPSLPMALRVDRGEWPYCSFAYATSMI